MNIFLAHTYSEDQATHTQTRRRDSGTQYYS